MSFELEKQPIVRVALFGCGRHARDCLVPVLSSLPFVKIAAYIDSVIEKAETLAGTKAVCHQTATAEVLESIDAAIVAVPPDSAEGILKALMDLGIPTYIEKPVASSSALIQNLIGHSDRGFVQVGFNYRYAPLVERLKNYLATPNRQRHLIIGYESRQPCGPEWGNPDPVASWLLHNGIHALDLCAWLQDSAVHTVSGEIGWHGDRYLLNVEVLHSWGAQTSLRLGNATRQFHLSISVREAHERSFNLQALTQLSIKDLTRGEESTLHAHPGHSKHAIRGHEASLRAFFNAIEHPTQNHPGLMAAKNAAELGEQILRNLSLQQKASTL